MATSSPNTPTVPLSHLDGLLYRKYKEITGQDLSDDQPADHQIVLKLSDLHKVFLDIRDSAAHQEKQHDQAIKELTS